MKRFVMVLIVSLALAGIGQAGWVPQVSGVTMSLRAVSFADSLVGLAGGLGGGTGDTLLRTTDGGANWQIVRTGYPMSVFGIDMVTPQNAWATGGGGTLKTTDGGLTWTQQSGGGYGISFSTLRHGLVVGSAGRVYRTTNGGSLWVQETVGLKGDLFDVCMADSLHAWAVGYDGGSDTESVVVSRDGGQTWARQQIPDGGTYMLTGISFSDTLHGLAVGGGQSIYWTENGGNTWNFVWPGDGKYKTEVVLVDSLWGWLVGSPVGPDGALISRTTDGGRTWTVQNPGTSANLYDVSFSDRRNGWAVGAGGTIVHTSDGGAGVEEEKGQGSRGAWVQGSKVRPNPFTSYTSIPGHGSERFEVFDITGKRVGTYRGNQVGMDLGTGVYFLKPEGKDEKPMRIIKVK